MEAQAPDATVMEDQPPDAMVGPSLPWPWLPKARQRLQSGWPRVPEMTWPRQTPQTWTRWTPKACPRRSLKGWQRPLTTWSCPRAPWMAKLHRQPLLYSEILAKNPGGGGEPASPGSKGGSSQEAYPGSGLGRTYVLTTVTEGAVSAIKQSQQIHV